MGGNVTLKGGTFTGGGSQSAGVNVNDESGSLSVTENVMLVGGGAGGMGVLTDALAGMVALLHRHCAGQRLIAQHTRKGGCAAFVKIGVPGEVISTNKQAIVVAGNVTLEGGTFTSKQLYSEGVYINSANASLSVVNPGCR